MSGPARNLFIGVAAEVIWPTVAACGASAIAGVGSWAAARASKRTSRTEIALNALTVALDQVQDERDITVARLDALQASWAKERERTAAELSVVRADLRDAQAHFSACERDLAALRSEVQALRGQRPPPAT